MNLILWPVSIAQLFNLYIVFLWLTCENDKICKIYLKSINWSCGTLRHGHIKLSVISIESNVVFNIYRIKNSGPKIYPCGTPYITFRALTEIIISCYEQLSARKVRSKLAKQTDSLMTVIPQSV